MSDTTATGATAGATFKPPRKLMAICAALAVVGLALFAVSLMGTPWRAWSNALLASYFYTSIALGAAVLIALMGVTKAGWGVVIRRIPEAMTGYLPIGMVTMLAVALFGMHDLYEWSHPNIVSHDHLLQHKAPLLNVTGFLVRLVVIFTLWIALTWAMRRQSVLQDSDGDERHTHNNVKLSAIFLIVFALSLTVATLDWLMSLEPHWFSTIFGVYHFAGLFTAAIAVIILFVVCMQRAGYLAEVNANHLHDLGKLLFAFCTFWAYIWVSQYLLIWYANIPEETGYYMVRQDHGWQSLWVLNLALRWVVPFLVLLPRPNKRNPKVLALVAVIVLIGHWLDTYLQIMPATAHFAVAHAGAEVHGPFFGLAEIGIFVALGAIFVIAVLKMLGRASLVPTKDPYLEESMHHHQ